MLKNIILFFIGITFFSTFNVVYAEVLFNEIQISPTEGRFIELYNDSDTNVDLTGWYIQRKTSTGSSFSSLVSNTNFTNKTINAHDYFVISKVSLTNSDIVLSSLTLTESNTIQIKNSNGDVVDKIGWGSVTDCIDPCPENPPEGKSIKKKNNGSWVADTPTPGEINEDTVLPDSGDSSSSSSSVSPTVINVSEIKNKKEDIKVKIITKSFVLVGNPLTLTASVLRNKEEVLSDGRYFWNFGDGDSKEITLREINNIEKFTHTFSYPGEYNVYLEYYPNYYGGAPVAFDQVAIKVIPIDVVISRVGEEQDFFVELSNDTNYDEDISNWIIMSDKKSFIIPRNTILGAKKKIIISPRVSGFSFADKYNLKLMTSQGSLVFEYTLPVVPVSIKQNLKQERNVSVEKITIASEVLAPIEKIPPTENLEASIVESDIQKNYSSYLPTLVSVVFIGASASLVYFIRRKRIIPQTGDDFEILDE